MNYIKSLQEQVETLEAENKRVNEGLIELIAYLSSSKFEYDTTVQTHDVITRINEVRFN